jgi:hypothetical protein
VKALRSSETISASAEKDQPKAPRDTPLKSKDDAKFFSEEAWKKVQPAAEKLLKEKSVDLLIETVPTPPKSDPDKVRAMSSEDREKFFKEYAIQRCKAEKLSGVYIVICKNPGSFYVEFSGPAASTFPTNFQSKLTKIIQTDFSDKKFDGGLTEALDLIFEAQKLGEKKP